MHVYLDFMNAEASTNCVSREEFESLQRELNYWQNTTIDILKKYLLDLDGELSMDALKSTNMRVRVE